MSIWFVTGSSRGLGRDIVVTALEAGHSVAATARKASDVEDLVAQYGDRVLPIALDVTDGEAAEKAMAQAKATFGRIDVVVNNAGYANTVSVEDIAIDDFEAQMATNFYGTVYVSKAALPIMREQGSGHIFQVASLGARLTAPGLSAYQSAKFAVRGFTLVLAQEVAPLGIKVTVLQPGGMRTDWAGSSMEVPEPSAPYQQTVGAFAQLLRDHCGHESSDPKKVAGVIVGLAGREDAPVDLLIGTDAWEYWGEMSKAVAAADAKWKDLTVSVAAGERPAAVDAAMDALRKAN